MFDQEGFTKSSAKKLRSDQWQEHKELFEFSDECTRLALRVSALLPKAKAKRQIVIGLFFARCLSHYQAGILLVESGMTIESLSLSRGCWRRFL